MMEIKHLAILLLVPLAFAVLIIETQKSSNEVTGFAVLQASDFEEGDYKVNPSFLVSKDYKFNEEYSLLEDDAKNIVDNCVKAADVGECLVKESQKMKCDESYEEMIFYNFVDRYIECHNQKENGVVCSFLLQSIDDFDSSFSGEYILEISEDEKGAKAVLSSKNGLFGGSSVIYEKYLKIGGVYYTDFKNRNNGINPDKIRMIFEYKDDGSAEIKSMVAAYSDNGKEKETTLSNIGEGRVMMHKTAGVSAFIMESEESSFKSLKTIFLPKKKAIKFCKKSEAKVRAYDWDKKEFIEDYLTYQFAVTYPELEVPLPIKKIEANDKKKAENSILLSWDKAKDKAGIDSINLDHYNIYCSKKQFIFDKYGNVDLMGEVPTYKSLNSDNPKIEVKKCVKENLIEAEVYYFTVTAVTKDGVEGPADRTASSNSIDDLSPGPSRISLDNGLVKGEYNFAGCSVLPQNGKISVTIFPVKSNEDGSQLKEPFQDITYFIHYKLNEPKSSGLNLCNENMGCVKINSASTKIFDKDSSLDGSAINKFEENKKYCFTAVAVDENENAISSLNSNPDGSLEYKFEKPEDWEVLSDFSEFE